MLSMQADPAQATPIDPSDDERERGGARWDAAFKKLGAIGKLDVTFAKVGERVGFFVSVAEGDEENLEIDVKSPIFEGRFNARREFFEGLRTQPSTAYDLFNSSGNRFIIPEAGISFERYRRALATTAKE